MRTAIMDTTTYNANMDRLKSVLSDNNITMETAHYLLTRNYQETRKAIPEEVREQMKLDKKEAAKQVKLQKAKERAEKLALKAKEAAEEVA